MKFYKKLYWGEDITDPKHKKKICWKLKHHAGQLQIFVIALTEDKDQVEIYHCAYLQQTFYKKHPPIIVGITKSYEDALVLLQNLVTEVVLQTGNADIRQYLVNCL